MGLRGSSSPPGVMVTSISVRERRSRRTAFASSTENPSTPRIARGLFHSQLHAGLSRRTDGPLVDIAGTPSIRVASVPDACANKTETQCFRCHKWSPHSDWYALWRLKRRLEQLRRLLAGSGSLALKYHRMRFEKIWVQQCRASKGIKRRFGAQIALDYLIREKLIVFAEEAERRPEFAKEFPSFLAAIWQVFNQYELAGYVASQKPAARKQLRRPLYMK